MLRRRRHLWWRRTGTTLPMSAMFFLWQAARDAGDLARAAAPYHALGVTSAHWPVRPTAAQQAVAVQLHGLVAAYLRYEEGKLAHHRSVVQCVAACTANWQGRGTLPWHWRRNRNQVLRFEFSLAPPSFCRAVFTLLGRSYIPIFLTAVWDDRLSRVGGHRR